MYEYVLCTIELQSSRYQSTQVGCRQLIGVLEAIYVVDFVNIEAMQFLHRDVRLSPAVALQERFFVPQQRDRRDSSASGRPLNHRASRYGREFAIVTVVTFLVPHDSRRRTFRPASSRTNPLRQLPFRESVSYGVTNRRTSERETFRRLVRLESLLRLYLAKEDEERTIHLHHGIGEYFCPAKIQVRIRASRLQPECNFVGEEDSCDGGRG